MRLLHKGLLIPLALVMFAPEGLAADGTQPKTLKNLYAAYQEAAAGRDRRRLIQAAEDVYQFSRENFGLTANTARAYFNLAKAHKARTSGSYDLWVAVIADYETVFGPDSIDMIDPLWEGANAAGNRGNWAQINDWYDHAAALAEQHDLDPAVRGQLVIDWANSALAFSGDAILVRRKLKNAREMIAPMAEKAPYLNGQLLMLEGKYAASLRRPEKAIAHLEDAVSALERSGPAGTVKSLYAHAMLVQLYEDEGLSEKATPHCRAVGEIKTMLGDFDYVPLYKKAPPYPQNAAHFGREGEVLLEFTVDENGFVRDLAIVESSDHSFDDAALEAARHFRFAPKIENGKPVAVAGVQNLIAFELSR